MYNWEEQQLTTDLDYPAAYVRDCLRLIDFDGRWIYRAGSDARGIRIERFRDICSEADLLLVRATPLTVWRNEYDLPRRRAFIDVDPGSHRSPYLKVIPSLWALSSGARGSLRWASASAKLIVQSRPRVGNGSRLCRPCRSTIGPCLRKPTPAALPRSSGGAALGCPVQWGEVQPATTASSLRLSICRGSHANRFVWRC